MPKPDATGSRGQGTAGDARVALVVAVTVVAEVGDFRRFANARQLMAYLGLVPSEHSSGSTIRRGGITKAGNALARRVLIEGAWTYRMNARVSRKLHDRLEPKTSALSERATRRGADSGRKALWICRCAWTTLTRRPQLRRATDSNDSIEKKERTGVASHRPANERNRRGASLTRLSIVCIAGDRAAVGNPPDLL